MRIRSALNFINEKLTSVIKGPARKKDLFYLFSN